MENTVKSSLDELTTSFSLILPIHMHHETDRVIIASGGSESTRETFNVEYLMPDTLVPHIPADVRMSRKGRVEQHFNKDEYQQLLLQRQPHKMAYGEISFKIEPLTDEQRDSVVETREGLVQRVAINCPVHIHHYTQKGFAAAGNDTSSESYSTEFLMHDSYLHQIPQNLRMSGLSIQRLFMTKEQYQDLDAKRKEMKDGYGRVTFEFNPLVNQG